MATYNTLNWRNENGMSAFPLAVDIEPLDVIVDARFIQFDNFIPVLEYVMVEASSLRLAITFDAGLRDDITYTPVSGDTKSVRIYTASGDRYLGSVSFGGGTETLWRDYVGRKLTYRQPFLREVVRSIPSRDAVYTLDSLYGDVTLARGGEDSSIFYNASAPRNALVFNAVAGHKITSPLKGLKQINLVKPLNNNINLAANDVIKVESRNAASLELSLVTGSTSKSFIIPTLAA